MLADKFGGNKQVVPPESRKPSRKRCRTQFLLVENRHQQAGVPLHKRDDFLQKLRGQSEDVKILFWGEAGKVFGKNKVLPFKFRSFRPKCI